jgi:hypothetical protein
MDQSTTHRGNPSGIPATSEHQAVKAVERQDAGASSQWLGRAMAIWLQGEPHSPHEHTVSKQGRPPR